MSKQTFVATDEIRCRFSLAMSEMYRKEVPQYGVLLELVAAVNAQTLHNNAALRTQLTEAGELDRLEVERHGAIRLGTAEELSNMRRIFAVMGMVPVGYYDLSVAGIPVHSTAFRPVTDAALALNPFRVFTSLLRLELIEDKDLRNQAAAILSKRRIFTPRALELTARFEANGGLNTADADEFVAEVRETFRWHGQTTVNAQDYHRLHDAHRLLADIVCFKGPHINHLTPRTLDIDSLQTQMPTRGIAAKEVIEGPPRRRCPILLRQTSFKALEEKVIFAYGDHSTVGVHTARFGEVEQRGMALTQAGRALYDRLLLRARDDAGDQGLSYDQRLAAAFNDFPDDLADIRQAGLAFFRYFLSAEGRAAGCKDVAQFELDAAIAAGHVRYEPITYEDFLPVSAAGIFQSNLGDATQANYAANAAKAEFECALGGAVLDEIDLYAAAQQRSLDELYTQLRALGAR